MTVDEKLDSLSSDVVGAYRQLNEFTEDMQFLISQLTGAGATPEYGEALIRAYDCLVDTNDGVAMIEFCRMAGLPEWQEALLYAFAAGTGITEEERDLLIAPLVMVADTPAWGSDTAWFLMYLEAAPTLGLVEARKMVDLLAADTDGPLQ